LEFKMPSGGMFLIGAAICGGLFLICQYWLNLAGAPEIVLIGLGVAAVIAEVFFLPTGGILAIGGLVAIATGLILAFMPDSYQFQTGDARWGAAVGNALVRAMRVLASSAAIDGTSAGAVEAGAPSLIGRHVRARTMLRPSGFVVVEGRDMAAVAEHGEMVAEGGEVVIVGAQLGELLVRPVAATPASADAGVQS